MNRFDKSEVSLILIRLRSSCFDQNWIFITKASTLTSSLQRSIWGFYKYVQNAYIFDNLSKFLSKNDSKSHHKTVTKYTTISLLKCFSKSLTTSSTSLVTIYLIIYDKGILKSIINFVIFTVKNVLQSILQNQSQNQLYYLPIINSYIYTIMPLNQLSRYRFKLDLCCYQNFIWYK